MSSNAKKRIEKIDIARGIAAICMILGHSFIVHPIDISNVGWCRALHLWIYSFHMELFFFLTGAVWSCRSFSDYIKKKSMRVLVPYVAFGCLSILLRMMGTSLVNNNESLGEGVTNFIFRGGGYWFLYVLFFMYLLYPGLDYLAQRIKLPQEWDVGLSIILVLLCSFVKMPTIFMIDSLLYYLPFFMMGKYLVGERKYLVSDETGVVKRTVAVVISIPLFIGLTVLYNSYKIVAIQQIRALSMIIAICGIINILLKLKKSKQLKKYDFTTNPISECGKYTLQLYLFNGYLLVIIRTIVVSTLKITNPLIIVLTITFGNLIITLFMCKKILPKIPIVRTVCGL